MSRFAADLVSDSIVAVEEYPNRWTLAVAMSDFGELEKNIGPLMDADDRAVGGVLVVLGDVMVNVLEPASRFGGPDYLRHDSIV